jgi:hypothetical protein
MKKQNKRLSDTSAVTNAVRPFKSLTEIPTGAALNDAILSALNEGKNIGYDPSFVDRTTSPVVAQREARWKDIEQPGL